MLRGRIKRERDIGRDFVPRLVVAHRFRAQRRPIAVADEDHVAAGLHVTGAPVMRSLFRCQGRRRSPRQVVKRHVDVAELGALGVGEEVRGIGAHPRPQDARLGDVVAHAEQHLVRAVEDGLGRRDGSSALTCPRHE